MGTWNSIFDFDFFNIHNIFQYKRGDAALSVARQDTSSAATLRRNIAAIRYHKKPPTNNADEKER